MCDILQPNARAPALNPQRQDAIYKRMARDERQERIAQRARAAQLRPRQPPAVVSALSTVPVDALPAPVEAQRDSCADVQGQRGEDERGLEERGLVVWAREEEVCVGSGERARHERDHGCVEDVGCEEGREGVGRVALDAVDWARRLSV